MLTVAEVLWAGLASMQNYSSPLNHLAYSPLDVPEGLEVGYNSCPGVSDTQWRQNADSTWDFAVDSEDKGI